MRTIYTSNASKRLAKSLSSRTRLQHGHHAKDESQEQSVLPRALVKGEIETYFMCTAR
jgi:hypothetical protein